ncbi:MAG: hypothetical protein WD512_07985 [Candidatus Paceibacterota bacterium]
MEPSYFISLKQDWDSQPHLDRGQGQHVARKKQEEQLIDFFVRRTEGSLLVSGKRGVGKSSIIFSTIQKAREKLDKSKKLVPVLINAPSFEMFDGSIPLPAEYFPKFKELVLQTIIRRLYSPASQIIEGKTKEQIKLLYTKAVAKEVRHEIRNLESQHEQSTKTETKTFSLRWKNFLAISLGIGAGLVLLFIPSGEFEMLRNIVSVLVAGIPSIGVIYKLKTKI